MLCTSKKNSQTPKSYELFRECYYSNQSEEYLFISGKKE